MRNNRGDVENKNHGAVTKDRSAADKGRSDKTIFERFDDELFFTHQAIDDEAEFAIARTDDDDEDSLRTLRRGFRLEAFEAFEADERENLLAQLKDFVLVDVVDFFVGNASNFDNRSDRNGVEPASHAKQKCLDAGES